MIAGACGGCGGELDDDALRIMAAISPGPRGLYNYRAVTETRIGPWFLCRACLVSPAGGLLRAMINDRWTAALAPRRRGRCEIRCADPVRRRFLLLTRRRAVDTVACPHCYGKADVVPLDGAPVRRRTLMMRLLRQEYARPGPAVELPRPRMMPADDALEGEIIPLGD